MEDNRAVGDVMVSDNHTAAKHQRRVKMVEEVAPHHRVSVRHHKDSVYDQRVGWMHGQESCHLDVQVYVPQQTVFYLQSH